uniref:Uncharacterized protein n=1 Tax=Lepeophtheirus salmonis TaxID=72036 RepID=A0A0K2TXA6_LEPSM
MYVYYMKQYYLLYTCNAHSFFSSFLLTDVRLFRVEFILHYRYSSKTIIIGSVSRV